ncbi:MAG: hypothetical protein AABX05_02915 [Nanoarchaeota archaeon]
MFPENKEEKPKNNSLLVMVAVIVAGLLLAVFIIRPGILGYGVYQQVELSNLSVKDYAQNLQQLNHDLDVAKTNLSSYSVFTEDLLQQVTSMSQNLADCKGEVEQVKGDLEQSQSDVSDMQEEIDTINQQKDDDISSQVAQKTSALEGEKTTCQGSLAEKQEEMSVLQSDYDNLVKNSARTICCKAKVDNPQINFYDVVDDKVVCLQEGTTELVC